MVLLQNTHEILNPNGREVQGNGAELVLHLLVRELIRAEQGDTLMTGENVDPTFLEHMENLLGYPSQRFELRHAPGKVGAQDVVQAFTHAMQLEIIQEGMPVDPYIQTPGMFHDITRLRLKPAFTESQEGVAALESLGNKRFFRNICTNLGLPTPLTYYADLTTTDSKEREQGVAQALSQALKLGSSIIIQEATSGGGVGTYIFMRQKDGRFSSQQIYDGTAMTEDELKIYVQQLATTAHTHQVTDLLIARFIPNNFSPSINCFLDGEDVTLYGFARQISDPNSLACVGLFWPTNDPCLKDLKEKIKSEWKILINKVQALGKNKIRSQLGFDLIIYEENGEFKHAWIECNARRTALTPYLTAMSLLYPDILDRKTLKGLSILDNNIHIPNPSITHMVIGDDHIHVPTQAKNTNETLAWMRSLGIKIFHPVKNPEGFVPTVPLNERNHQIAGVFIGLDRDRVTEAWNKTKASF